MVTQLIFHVLWIISHRLLLISVFIILFIGIQFIRFIVCGTWFNLYFLDTLLYIPFYIPLNSAYNICSLLLRLVVLHSERFLNILHWRLFGNLPIQRKGASGHSLTQIIFGNFVLFRKQLRNIPGELLRNIARTWQTRTECSLEHFSSLSNFSNSPLSRTTFQSSWTSLQNISDMSLSHFLCCCVSMHSSWLSFNVSIKGYILFCSINTSIASTWTTLSMLNIRVYILRNFWTWGKEPSHTHATSDSLHTGGYVLVGNALCALVSQHRSNIYRNGINCFFRLQNLYKTINCPIQSL